MKRTRTPARESLSEQAYKKIEESILTARLEPGTWITETAISEELGIGRTPVREAAQRLAFNGLVEVVPGRGMRVTDVNAEDQIQILELRRVVEDMLVRRALRRIAPSEVQAMRGLARRLENASRITDPMRFHALDLEFKGLLLQCAKHKYAESVLRPLWSATRRFLWVHRTLENKVAFAQLVARVIEAIVAGDETAAVRANAARLDQLDEFVRATLDA
ncbi:MAG: GntR family transcriptional regulator [Hyphomicrobiaceae bacterium]